VSYIGLNDPEKESDFTIIGETNQTVGWKKYTYQKQLTTSASGEVWIGVGFGATWETSRTYYMDLIGVDISHPSPLSPSAPSSIDCDPKKFDENTWSKKLEACEKGKQRVIYTCQNKTKTKKQKCD
jgi:hypothetical protein